jgi:hypothetical protein
MLEYYRNAYVTIGALDAHHSKTIQIPKNSVALEKLHSSSDALLSHAEHLKNGVIA